MSRSSPRADCRFPVRFPAPGNCSIGVDATIQYQAAPAGISRTVGAELKWRQATNR